MTMLMDYTDEGRTRLEEVVTDGLVFRVSHIAYGSSGFNPGTPTAPLVLVPSATSLVSEVFRKEIPPAQITMDEISYYRGKETVYTTVGGTEFTSVLGEAGLIATVEDPGTTGLAIGYEFLLAHAHFPRIVLSLYGRFAIKWPLDFEAPGLVYTSALGTLGGGISLLPTVFGPGFASFASTGNPLPPGLSLNPATGEISGTFGTADLLGGTTPGVWDGIEIEADGGPVLSPPFTISVNGVTLPEPIFYTPMELDADTQLVFDGTGQHPYFAGDGSPGDAPGAVGRAIIFDSGNSDVLEGVDDPVFDIGTNDYAIVGLTQVATGNEAVLFSKHDQGTLTNPGISLRVEHNQATYTHGDGSGNFLTGSIGYGSIDDAAFHSIVWSVTRASNGELYVDGVSAGTAVVSSQPGSVDNSYFPTQGGITNSGIADSIDDEVALFDQALDDNEAATVAWLGLTGRSLGNWISGNGPSVPNWPVLTNLPNGVAATIDPTVPSFEPEGQTFTYVEIDSLPTGLSLNAGTGQISGTPTVNGVYDIRVGVSDGLNLVISPYFRITVS